jgi:DNA polymerase III subunit delta'
MSEHAPVPLSPWLQRQLQTLMQQRGHALLLSGPTGLGQYPLALALARAWLCEEVTDQGACGHCASCHAIDVRTHPDLFVLMPETLSLELGWPLDEKTQDKIDRKELKPSRLIRVDAAREAVAFTQFTRSRGTTKVVLIYPAERMNTESANTLLKTLEEPAGAVRFILASEAAHALLPTIRSRCQAHVLQWPQADEALHWLQQTLALQAGDRSPVPDSELRVWLKATGGRPEEVFQWVAMGAAAEVWSGVPQAIARGDFGAMADWPVARQMDVLQKLCHDLQAVRAGGTTRFFEPQDLPAAPLWPRLLHWHQQLRQAARTLEHPFQAALMQEAWASQARQAFALN